MKKTPRDFTVLTNEQAKAVKEDSLLKAILSTGCYANYRPDVTIVMQLLEIEKQAGITGEARGILVAGACNESGFNPRAMGDWKDIETGERCPNRTPGCKPTSFGMVQQGNWVKKHLKKMGVEGRIPQFQWETATRYWAEHLVRQKAKVKSYCGYQSERDVWRASHKTAVTKSLCSGRYRTLKNGTQRCREYIPRCHLIGNKKVFRGSHWGILTSWQDVASRPIEVKVTVAEGARARALTEFEGKKYPTAVVDPSN